MARKTRYAILGVLSIEPSSGYEIRHFLDSTVRHFWSESFGQIYPILHALEREDLVESEERFTGARPKKVYTLKPKGEAELKRWIVSGGTDIKPGRNEMLLKLVFAGPDEFPYLVGQIERFKHRLEETLTEYAAIEKMMAAEVSSDPRSPVWKSTLRFGQLATGAHLAWSNETLKTLRELCTECGADSSSTAVDTSVSTR